ncbi:MutT/nudix family transporter protein [Legionella birminghamensis]|uniref:MutT/nudix family transporter protein n=1 Tax=Legionella birminghamensis TaxID=28083 RepID=A0A378II16_9GAMM|nr:CoA pyrophosphatase [Legionella birminghamensis]KTC75225.1 MutT/nudix family transporter protein [Legionella birminghamensis]STX31824.1 MutT/nudix family transporter protein [Legionella birminghamensis]
MNNIASVIVLFEKNSKSLVLTIRNPFMRSHPGEICFPGGRWQDGDQTLLDTGLRELKEELGIGANRVQLISAMEKEHTLTGYTINPWFASIDSIVPYRLNPGEVSELLMLPVNAICVSDNYKEIEFKRDGLTFKTIQFLHESKFVWGATARIMQQFCKTDYLNFLK